MKWFAMIALALAILVRFAWHSSFALAFPVNANTHRGYSISSLLFWVFLLTGLSLLFLVLIRRTHC